MITLEGTGHAWRGQVTPGGDRSPLEGTRSPWRGQVTLEGTGHPGGDRSPWRGQVTPGGDRLRLKGQIQSGTNRQISRLER
jgi:hypothetical protein